MHWCADETMALMSAIPFVGYFWRRLKARLHGHKLEEDRRHQQALRENDALLTGKITMEQYRQLDGTPEALEAAEEESRWEKFRYDTSKMEQDLGLKK